MTNLQSDVLSLFNCLVVNDRQEVGSVYPGLLTQGIVTDFIPEGAQTEALAEFYKPLPITTLFTREERETVNIADLVLVQIMHYIEVYGLGAPGLFDLEVTTGTLMSFNYVAGISVTELAMLVQNLLYTNAPVKDAKLVQRIIDGFKLTFDINRVANNELRVVLWNDALDAFTNGDDVVRFLCHEATGEALLIKSKEVIAAVKAVKWAPYFFELHALPLAQVFNRHKRLILAAKNKSTAKVINRIARLSKVAHVPLRESIAKTFVHGALVDVIDYPMDVLAKISVRDKMKYLNLLAQKKLQSTMAAFNIRNGKVWTTDSRPVYQMDDILRVERAVLVSLAVDLRPLEDLDILLDANVDYGLPVSRKQTIGRLPFGTTVSIDSAEISSGMYWENEWGATDLDLSTIDMDGNRVGWGQSSGYNDRSIIFSGDLTDARNGAMEFMTSRGADYGLFVNIYSGKVGSEMELVVGSNRTKKGRKAWMDDVLIREKHTLSSRGTVIGFVKGKTFVVYAGRLSNRRMSGENPIINQSRVDFWTVQSLLRVLDIGFDLDRRDDVEYDHDLSYSSFSLDKLEAVFGE